VSLPQKAYRPAVQDALDACRARFGERLRAVYLSGSVAFGEAWLGTSDVDFFVFLSDDPTDADAAWRQEVEKRLAEHYPQAAKEFHLTLRSVGFMKDEAQGWKFILRYNAVRLHGKDLLEEFESCGLAIPIPDAEAAGTRLGFARKGLEGLKNGRLPDELFGKTFPTDVSQWRDDDYLITRKLARYFVLVEGAYVLMADGEFRSFRQEDVLEPLERSYPQWTALFRTVRQITADPFEAGISPRAFAEQAASFTEWAHARAKSG
jgi:predicted nucleotidyltransferase